MIHLIEKQTSAATLVGNDPCEDLLCLTEMSSSQAEPVLVDWLEQSRHFLSLKSSVVGVCESAQGL